NAADELVPGEVRVRVLGASDGDEVAQRVGTEFLEEVTDVDHNPLGGGELGAGHGEELGGDDLGRQVQLAQFTLLTALAPLAGVAKHFTWPDLGVEGDVVLAHEVVGHCLWGVPPLAPGLRVAGAPGPLNGCGEVTDDRIEPDVELLGVVVLPALDGDGHTPVDIAAHRAGTDVLQQVQGELQDVRTPVVAPLQPLLQRLGQGGQVEHEVFGVDELWGLGIDLGARVDQVGWVQLVAAVIELVAAG